MTPSIRGHVAKAFTNDLGRRSSKSISDKEKNEETTETTGNILQCVL